MINTISILLTALPSPAAPGFGNISSAKPPGRRISACSLQRFQAGQGQLVTDEVNGGNLFYRMQTVFHYEELMKQDTSGILSHRDVYYPSVGLFLVHSDTMDLAVKAGDNADSHNHNDTGSITLYKKGLPILADIGVETYTRKTFSPRRYEIWTMQSGYHNLPTICGTDQKDGVEYRAEKW